MIAASHFFRRRAGVWLWPLALAAGLTMNALGAPASAQTTAETDGADAAVTNGAAVILVINMERIRNESAAARSIQDQAAEIRARIQTDLADRQDALRAEEQELVELRGSLDPSAFAARVAAFEDAVRALKRDSSERGSLLQKAVFEAREELDRRLRPELIRLMEERRASVMLDASIIVVSARALDVTDEAIARFDASTPEVAVDWPDEAE